MFSRTIDHRIRSYVKRVLGLDKRFLTLWPSQCVESSVQYPAPILDKRFRALAPAVGGDRARSARNLLFSIWPAIRPDCPLVQFVNKFLNI